MDISLKQWISNFKSGMYDAHDVKTQCAAGWYDWFCKETSLGGKLQRLAPKVLQVAKSKKVDPETMYVFFKNNCPMSGPLYDDFRICDIQEQNVIFTITPKSGHTGKAEVWGRENDFKEPLASGSWKDIKAFFNI